MRVSLEKNRYRRRGKAKLARVGSAVGVSDREHRAALLIPRVVEFTAEI